MAYDDDRARRLELERYKKDDLAAQIQALNAETQTSIMTKAEMIDVLSSRGPIPPRGDVHEHSWSTTARRLDMMSFSSESYEVERQECVGLYGCGAQAEVTTRGGTDDPMHSHVWPEWPETPTGRGWRVCSACGARQERDDLEYRSLRKRDFTVSAALDEKLSPITKALAREAERMVRRFGIDPGMNILGVDPATDEIVTADGSRFTVDALIQANPGTDPAAIRASFDAMSVGHEQKGFVDRMADEAIEITEGLTSMVRAGVLAEKDVQQFSSKLSEVADRVKAIQRDRVSETPKPKPLNSIDAKNLIVNEIKRAGSPDAVREAAGKWLVDLTREITEVTAALEGDDE